MAQLEAVVKDVPAIAEMSAARKDIAKLLQQFLSAVNAEDRKTAAACLTPEMAKALEKLPSLRSAIGGGGEVEKIEFRAIAGFGAPGGKRFVDARVAVTVKGGAAKTLTARMHLQSTTEGWKITAPS